MNTQQTTATQEATAVTEMGAYLLSYLKSMKAVAVGHGPILTDWECHEWRGEPDHKVLSFRWHDGGTLCGIDFTEKAVAAAKCAAHGSWVLESTDGLIERIDFYSLHPLGEGGVDVFSLELMESCESLEVIEQTHGGAALATLFYLASAISRNSFIEVSEQNQALDIVRALPSADTWMKYVHVEQD